MKAVRIGAILWMLCLQYFLGEAIAIAGWPGPYSLAQNFISDLGALQCGPQICSPLHPLMNASFVLQGVLIAAGTALVWRAFPKGKLLALALALVGASGLGVFLVGLNPEDANPSLHYLGAAENFLFCNLGMAVMGVAMFSSNWISRAGAALTLAAGLLGLTGFALLAAHEYLGLGVGAIERVTAYPFPLWIAAMGLNLLRSGQVSAPRSL